MDITVYPGYLHGTISAPPSKSCAHRIFICAALADKPTQIHCGPPGRDVEATIACLQALGANITKVNGGFQVSPIHSLPKAVRLPCGESGSTLRFLLPLVGALGVDATFFMEGRLPQRPLSPLWEEMQRHGCYLSRLEDNTIFCTGKLQAGDYHLEESASSQFHSGLMMALPLVGGSRLYGRPQSAPYIEITLDILRKFGVYWNHFCLMEPQTYRSPGSVAVEGDWSGAAFLLAANALGSSVEIQDLSADSLQGDREIVKLPDMLQEHCTLSAASIPDLVPILSIVAACRHGAVFTDISRLRLKESDRVDTVCRMLSSLGGHAIADENTLTVLPAALTGGTVDPGNDHRIAMAAAIAATVCKGPVTVLNAQCVEKSYPNFWEDFKNLGGTL